jgi:hypothetical protein
MKKAAIIVTYLGSIFFSAHLLAVEISNAITANAITANAITANAITANGIILNGTNVNGVSPSFGMLPQSVPQNNMFNGINTHGLMRKKTMVPMGWYPAY